MAAELRSGLCGALGRRPVTDVAHAGSDLLHFAAHAPCPAGHPADSGLDASHDRSQHQHPDQTEDAGEPQQRDQRDQIDDVAAEVTSTILGSRQA